MRIPRKIGSIWFSGLVLFVSSIALTQYRVFYGNQALQIPLVYWLQDPSLYPQDPFVSTLVRYPSMLWRVIAFSSQGVSLETILFSAFLVERALTLYASAQVAKAFSTKSKLAPIGAMAMFALAPKPILGSGTIVISYFEQTGFAIAFLLLAAAEFYNRRNPIRWSFWLAISFNLNGLYGGYALTYFFFVFLVDPVYRSNWRKWLKAFGIFILLTSPVLALAFSTRFAQESPSANLWLLASRIRFPHHLYPLTWGRRPFLEYGVLAFTTLAVLYQRRTSLEEQRLFKHVTVWTSVSAAWLFLAFLVAYGFQSPMLLILHPARASDLWYCVAGIALITTIASMLERNGDKKFTTVALLASILFWHPIPYALAAMGVVVLISEPLWRFVFRGGKVDRLVWVVTLFVFSLSIYGWITRRDHMSIEALTVLPPPSLRDIADWAQKNTASDAVFLVDPGWDEFRSLAKRPVFVTWKDGSAMLWDRPFVTEWTNRLQALGCDILSQLSPCLSSADLVITYRQLTDDDVVRLVENYKLQYWVIAVEKKSRFSVVYRNQLYKVLDVSEASRIGP